MAKSLRSKWKRKMRAEKRIRYGEKEKAKLVKMLESYESEKKEKNKVAEENEMVEEKIESESGDKTSEKMETESQLFKMSSLQNEHGNYPVWMSQKKIKKQKSLLKAKKLKLSGIEGKIHKKKNIKTNRKQRK